MRHEPEKRSKAQHIHPDNAIEVNLGFRSTALSVVWVG